MHAHLLRICSALALLGLPVLPIRADHLPVVPAPRHWEASEGTVSLQHPVILLKAADREALDPVVRLLAEDWKLMTGEPLPVREAGTAHEGTGLLLTRSLEADSPEAYELDIGDDILLNGASPRGVFYATRTLLQWARVSPQALPRGSVRDAPTYRHRMLMLDTGRKFFPMDVLKDYLRAMAWLKMNELHLHLSDEAFGGGYTGFRVACETYPGLTSVDGFYSVADLRELQDFARARGITITPEIDMPGHARVFTDYWPDLLMPGQSPSYMDVTKPETVERMKRLLDEMIPLFDAPDFHIGTDEYRVSGTREEKERLHEGFRQFINTMNAHVRSHGKTTRIWSGFEHMLGTTDIDPTVTIDMWETDDARAQITRGHRVINSNHGRTYIVPGAHYYGVSNPGIYQGWEPWMVSSDAARNPEPADPHLLGGKLHVWNDQGPTGYTMTEIADLTFPSLLAFSEKMWGTKGSDDYAAFQTRAAQVARVPGVQVLDRLPAGDDGRVLDLPGPIQLSTPDSRIPLPFADTARRDLEMPWTLVMEVNKSAESTGRGVILSSDQAELCDRYQRDEEIKRKDPTTGKEIREKVTRQGLGMVRAAGTAGPTPAEAVKANDLSRVYGDSLPVGQWVTVAVVANRRHTAIHVDGISVGSHREQSLCPLAYAGGAAGASLVGSLRNIQVWNRALRPREVARHSGLEIPENLAYQATATASAWHHGYPLQPEHLCDEQPETRWSSGQTRDPHWVAVDLGSSHTFSRVHLTWETAYAKSFSVEVSEDGRAWKNVAEGQGAKGPVTVTFTPQTARHVRVRMRDPATGWGYSIHELEIWP